MPRRRGTRGRTRAEESLARGVAAHERGDLADAAEWYQRVLDAHPHHADATHLLGLVALRRGDATGAVRLIRQALTQDAANPAYHKNLGNALGALGAWEEAAEAFRRAVSLAPEDPRALSGLGNALVQAGRTDEGLKRLQEATAAAPDFAEGHYNLGTALWRAGRHAAAEAALRRATELAPGLAPAHYNLGCVLLEAGRPEEARACLSKAAGLAPDDADVHNNLGSACLRVGLVEGAAASFLRALELRPDFAAAHSNLLLCLQYDPDMSPEALLDLHQEWSRRHGGARRHHGADVRRAMSVRGRPLRIGLVSPDLGRHPVGYFLLGLLEHHDPRRLHFTAYSDREDDDVTDRLKAAAEAWRDTRGTDLDGLEHLIRSDGIDVLVDLAGHTGGNRLPLFARRAAPVQVTWAGYVGTTGLSAMDYILTDRHYTPHDEVPAYTERPLRLPHAYVTYTPPSYAPDPGAPRRPEGNGITFASFNNPAKLNPQVLDAWAAVLEKVPGSRLLLGYQGMDTAPMKERVRRAMAAHGVDEERLEIRGGTSHPELLAAYQEVDIALDPFPYSGGLTTCEALWMGVPVVTLRGRTFASRHATSYLTELGLEDLVTHTHEAYVARAVTLAADRDRLTALRCGLRPRMAASPLCDHAGFARAFAELMEGAAEGKRA